MVERSYYLSAPVSSTTFRSITDRTWWKQIYPASFKDSTGSGRGDLKGIIDKLDYVKKLGVDAIWVSPFFSSLGFDNGYDIDDYQKVNPLYGTFRDAELLISTCHSLGLKVLFDLVINHSSQLHRWFLESRSSRDNPKRDWYIWRDPKWLNGKKKEPNNWKGCFGGSVWELDELTQQYYLHYFTPQQPDFNWDDDGFRKAIYEEAILFWLKRGVDGFRIDAVNMYSKRREFPDADITDPSSPWQPATQFMSNGPRLHDFLKEMRRETFSKYGAVTIGELPETSLGFRSVIPFVSTASKELDLAIQWNIGRIVQQPGTLLCKDWRLSQLKRITATAQQLVDPKWQAWAVTCLESHDLGRSVSRFGDESKRWRRASAKMLATYLLTLSGTPIIYQGEEIGMVNLPKSWSIEEYKDCRTQSFWKDILVASKSDPSLPQQALGGLQQLARDNARTPMQWNSDPLHAGFSTSEGETWMRVNDSYLDINVEDQESDASSVLAYYRELLKLRKEHKDLFVYGMIKEWRWMTRRLSFL